MSKYEESSHKCVPNLIRAHFVVGNQNNYDKFGFSLYHLNKELGKMYSGFCSRPILTFSPHFGALLNYF
jgi:hypothetical protein